MSEYRFLLIFIDYYWLILIFIDYEICYLFSIKCAIWINKPFTELYLLCFMLLHIECLKFVAFPHQHRSGTSEVRKQVFCDNPVGLIKTRERVQSSYRGHTIRPWFMTQVHGLLLIIIDYIDCNQWLIFIDWYHRESL